MMLSAMRRAAVAALISCSACASYEHHSISQAGTGPRILCITAHPDDEIAFAGTLFKIATHLEGSCDLAVITNGEGGYKYSTIGESIYGERWQRVKSLVAPGHGAQFFFKETLRSRFTPRGDFMGLGLRAPVRPPFTQL